MINYCKWQGMAIANIKFANSKYRNIKCGLIIQGKKCMMCVCVSQKIAYCITPEHEQHMVAEGNVRQFKVSVTFL